ncbi:hypothetical protein CUR178_07322 [Leishmania enriettii]|uniref:Exonuclease domain-containing protein n=1 Tax=Leishmania enriettii TaxID=5663 RepID=A0A836HX63_LEIEN|nr:hypothetical protein CUR178_07322 [Leishmania enriettii]
MPSCAPGNPSAALDREVAQAARRTRSSSSGSSSVSSSPGKPSDVLCASPLPAVPTIVGATVSVLSTTMKKSRHKKARKEEDAVREAVTWPPQSPQHGHPHLLPDAAAAPSLLRQDFCEVELQFQLEQDRAQRSTLAPRDIADLILWSVPTPVPIIESPRIFFIKNKSHVRNAVVIYVNGWSYDEMLCTGVGLPRGRGEAYGDGSPRGEATPSFSTDPSDTTTAAKWRDDHDGSGAPWIKELCSAMLSPVREGRCWARPGRGTGCAGGVQYCPLFIPSTRNELERDLWWRNDAPRRPRASSVATSSASNHFGPNRSRGGVDGETVDVSRRSPAVKDARGVGTMFQQAMQVHAKDSGTGDSTASAKSSLTAASTPTVGSPTLASDAFQQQGHLWQNRALLQQYALHLPEHAIELQELGFILVPPQESTATAAVNGGGGAGANDGEEEEEKEAWARFAAPSTPEVAGGSTSAARAVKVVAFDCEMVQVEGGESALARATLFDVLTGSIVLDLLVKPRQRITDYRTRFSGIDAAMLEPVSTTLADCQHALQRIIDTDTFVVGHSLENDFKACKCIPNCYVLDTTRLFPHPAGLPHKNALRFLAQRYLQRRIQQGSHDSAIDAIVSAELTQLKLINGPSFGVRPRVSVLGLIAEAAGSATDGAGEGNGAGRAAEAGPEVQLHLFDDAVTLSALLPVPQRKSTAPAAHGELSGDPESSAPPTSSASFSCIDAVPVRHDEDAMGKAVRVLKRRATQLAREAAVVGSGTDGDAARRGAPRFSLFWVQLTQAKVDVVQPPAPPPPTPPTAVGAEEEYASMGSTVCTEDRRSADASCAHTAAQFRTVHETNRRVLRIIEASPNESLIVVLTGRCDGEAGGNHLSRAQGTCFAFVKDSSAPGPRAEELAKLTDENNTNALPRASAACTATHGTSLPCLHPLATATAEHDGDSTTAMTDNTPPACQQQ